MGTMEMADRRKPTKIMNVYGAVYQVAKVFSQIHFPSRPHIKKLEIVTITQDLLLGHGFPNPSKLLHARIQIIELLHPNVRAFAWLDALNKAHIDFPNLKAVYLICEDFQDGERVTMYEKYSDLMESREMYYEVILHCPAERATCDIEPHEEDPRTLRM